MIEPAKEVVVFNTVVTQAQNGKLEVYVSGERMRETAGVQINAEGTLVLALPCYAFRVVARDDPKKQAPTFETKDNVISFPTMQAYREQWAKDDEPTDDGGAAA